VKDYLALWFEGLPRRHRVNLMSVMTVTGKCFRHLGGHSAYAQVRLRLEPATQFEVSEVPPDVKFRVQKEGKYFPDDFDIPKNLEKLLDCAIVGFLDSTLLDEQAPKPEFRIFLEEIEFCPIESSEWAFREAGRDAGKKLIEAFHNEWRDGIGSMASQRQKPAGE
jgi:hypothetical protein